VTDHSIRWRRAVLPLTATIRDAIQNLNDVALRIVLVTDAEGALLGTVSDGDIRRGLLRGVGLDSLLTSVLHRDPLVVPDSLGHAAVRQLMATNKILHIPIVDSQSRLCGLHVWDAIGGDQQLDNLLVVMAGGKGTRLKPFTESCPKPMLPIGGKPMLQHVIERARAEGITRIAISIHYLGHMIEDYFGDGRKFGVDVTYVREDAPLGTAGALSALADRPSSTFLVTNADVMTDVSFARLLAFHVGHGASATMAVSTHVWQHPYGVVRTQGVDVASFEEKPVSRTYINAGVYALEPTALDHIPKGEHCDMPHLFDLLRESGARTVAFPLHESWTDVGRHDDLQAARDRAQQDPQ
jgi:dTDP-glucose pyrophosphorylase